jgi:hypothetical protein
MQNKIDWLSDLYSNKNDEELTILTDDYNKIKLQFNANLSKLNE